MRRWLLLLLLLFALIPTRGYGALAAAGVWEIRTAGSDTNGAYFNPGASGVDYSQQDAAQLSLTDVVTTSTTTVTSVTGGFTTAMIGNGINIAGTVYEITARASTNSITVDRNTGTGAGQTGKVGGAAASPGYVAGKLVAGNDVWIKSGTYNIGGGTANTSGNKVSLTVLGTADNMMRWIGYNATRGDGGTAPVLTATAGSLTVFYSASGSHYLHVENLTANGNGQTSVQGFTLSDSGTVIYRCKAMDFDQYGINLSTAGLMLACEATACRGSSDAIYLGSFAMAVACNSHNNNFRGFDLVGDGSAAVSCISSANGESGFLSQGYGCGTLNCVAHGNTGAGYYRYTGTLTCLNSIASGNLSNAGFYSPSAGGSIELVNCAGYSNTGGNYDAATITGVVAFQALSGSPFTNAASGDFSLNNTAGAGASCRGAGIPGVFPAGLTTGYLDIGGAQHASAVAGPTWGWILP